MEDGGRGRYKEWEREQEGGGEVQRERWGKYIGVSKLWGGGVSERD